MLQDSRFIKIKNVLTKKVIMKKVNKISLYNLSKVGLSDKEMSMINGGYSGCVGVCFESVCRCAEDAYGEFYSTEGVIEQHSNTDAENTNTQQILKGTHPGY